MKRYTVHERIVEYAKKNVDEIRDRSLLCGLNSQDAERNRYRYGYNSLAQNRSDTVLYRLRRAFINPFTIILFFLVIISFVADVVLANSVERNHTTVLIVVAMLMASGIIRFIQEMKAKRTLEKLTGMVSTTLDVKRNGRWVSLPSEEIVVFDVIKISAGDRVPADAVIISSKDLFVSQSVITGESGISEKNSKSADSEYQHFSQYTNILFAGSTVIGGSCEALVLAVGEETLYGSISNGEHEQKSAYDKGSSSIASVLIRFMLVLVPVVYIATGITRDDWFSALIYAMSVSVGLTPELLPMVISACLAKGSAIMGRKQTIVKNVNAMQSLGSMDVLCVDKTGTLTGDRVMLEYYMDILGNESSLTLEYALVNSRLSTSVSNHLDEAIMMAEEIGNIKAEADTYTKIDEVPFDHSRRLASVLVEKNNKRLLLVKGSVDDVCKRCRYAEYRGELHDMDISSVHEIVDEMMDDGMKLLAVAYKNTENSHISEEDEQELVLVGFLAFFDAPKKSAASAISKLKDLNVNIKVLTGDQMNVAISICHRLGIDSKNILTGSRLATTDENELPMIIERTSIFAELSPKQKAQIVEILKDNGHIVGFMGDGMNDLPAIIGADVGISVDTAAESIKESADVILLKKDLEILEEGVLEGRKAFSNMSKYVRITASSNFGNILSIVFASMLLPFFPMTSVQLLLLNLLYDTMCLVLPWDEVDEEEIKTPCQWSGRNLAQFMGIFGPVSTVFDLATYAFMFFVLCPSICGGHFQMLDQAGQLHFISVFQTGWFLESMWTQILILHLLRTRKLSVLKNHASMPVMVVTAMGIMAFTALSFSPLGDVIGMDPLPIVYFIFLIVIVALYLLLITFVKLFYVRRRGELV